MRFALAVLVAGGAVLVLAGCGSGSEGPEPTKASFAPRPAPDAFKQQSPGMNPAATPPPGAANGG